MAYFNSDSFFQVVETNDRSIAKKLSLNCQLDEDSLDLFKLFFFGKGNILYNLF